MHSALDFCSRLARKENNVPLHKRSQEFTVLMDILYINWLQAFRSPIPCPTAIEFYSRTYLGTYLLVGQVGIQKDYDIMISEKTSSPNKENKRRQWQGKQTHLNIGIFVNRIWESVKVIGFSSSRYSSSFLRRSQKFDEISQLIGHLLGHYITFVK